MSQLRKHLKITFRVRWRCFLASIKLGKLGLGVYLDSNTKFLRYTRNIQVHDDVVIKEGVRICSCNETAYISIGNRTTVGYHTFIFSSESIIIGNDCLIAPFVYIVDSNHETKKTTLINQQPNKTAPIVIGDDVWIGSNVTILRGVNIGTGAVVAANSVVNRDIPEYEVWGGSPAKKIGNRD